jgi:hypothetical protein
MTSWDRTQGTLKTITAYLFRAGIVAGVLTQCGCGDKSKSSTAESADGIRGEQAATANASPASEPQRLKRLRPTSQPHEVSMWETNTAPAFSANRRVVPPFATLPPTTTGSPSVAQALLDRLAHLNLSGARISPAQAKEMNALFEQLRGQGAAAVPAIRDFLQSHKDVNFDAAGGAELMDYSSLRLALIDTLHQMGGPEAATAAAEALQNTTDPLEIALLSLTLEQQSPGQYRDVEISAANAALSQALSGNWKGGDVSALFETFQAIGDTNVAPLLKQAASKWNYYATLALAGLPDGAGIPSLIQLAKDPAITSMGSGDFALRPLAQVAMLYPDAAQALVQQASQNQIRDSAWPTVASSLAGTYIQYGNQIFGTTAPPASWSPADISQRITLLNQLLSVTSSQAGRQALQNAITSLSNRLPK